MRVEKWQALGNDYLVVDEPLTGDQARLLCDRHHGPGADGALVLGPPDAPGFAARVRIFNPDGSEAELSGNGVRQALLALHRRARAPSRELAVQTLAGEVRATILDARTCRTDLGRAAPGIAGEVEGFAFQQVLVGNPQCAIGLADRAALEALDLAAIGPRIERHPLFLPARTNVSWSVALADDALRTRIFERGVGETASSGTGATGAAVAHVLRGGRSPVTVHLDGGELEVDVGEDLRVGLTGWAEPVYAATLSDELVARLRATGPA